jgi:hypothetical protein
MTSTITFKFNRAVGIPGPKGETLMPRLHNKTIRNPITGVLSGSGAAAIQEYNYDETYTVSLLEEEKELPEHMDRLGPEVRQAFVQTFANELADNHAANETFRKSLQYYEKQGHVTILEDSFKDFHKKESLNEKATSPSSSQDSVSPPSRRKANKQKTSIPTS